MFQGLDRPPRRIGAPQTNGTGPNTHSAPHSRPEPSNDNVIIPTGSPAVRPSGQVPAGVIGVRHRPALRIRGRHQPPRRIIIERPRLVPLRHLGQVVQHAVAVGGLVVRPAGIFRHLGNPPQCVGPDPPRLAPRIGRRGVVARVGGAAGRVVRRGDRGHPAERVVGAHRPRRRAAVVWVRNLPYPPVPVVLRVRPRGHVAPVVENPRRRPNRARRGPSRRRFPAGSPIPRCRQPLRPETG